MNQEEKIAQLERKIGERLYVIKKILPWVETITIYHGKVIEKKERDSCSRVVWEFKDFDGFDLQYIAGEYSMGGDKVKISMSSVPVFEVDYSKGHEDECRVERFSANFMWLQKFGAALLKEDEIIAARKKQQGEKAEEKKTEISDEEKLTKLKEQAKRLSIAIIY